ncbi:DUF533 domain-containing protein [Haemophilus haemoglobinophilus]|nr:DUF533 domain-containing protein [Canicola haemoglobinophilus]
MNFNRLLNQVLNIAKEQVGSTMQGNSTADIITKAGGGAAVIGLLSMFLGRKGGANLTKLGSLAALGSLAYKAYQSYQQNQDNTSITEQQFNSVIEQNTDASQLILQVMIAAAASDGEISAEERQAIIAEAGNVPEVYQWLENEIKQPITISEIASKVGNNQALATQLYLAARIICADLQRKEIVFLANLATALNLDDQLVEQLEKQAGF